ncbi:hypothetical protein ElyMa_000020000 [Elysia marginata]|uniref:Uncharacterized protein n=1 Tax=Elysia marginata TaxID=1093978 RepID=A0AAV4EBL2_9GAST|nr:hypothetical protein ElyMa_000020000 [Elysia marginata]
MCVNSLSQGLNVDLPRAGLEPQTSRSESRASTTTPRRHTIDGEWITMTGLKVVLARFLSDSMKPVETTTYSHLSSRSFLWVLIVVGFP